MSRPEPATQYEALRHWGAPELPEGYAYQVLERDQDGDRLVRIVTLRRAREGAVVLPRYSPREWDRVYSNTWVWRFWRWVIPIGDRRWIVAACRYLAWQLRHDLRVQAREEAKSGRLHIDGPLR